MKLLLILIFHAIILAFANDQRETLEKKPNIVLILADDVGTGDLPFFWPDDESKSKVQMPHLKQLASKGVTFQDAHSSPKCGPSRYSILSGNYAHRGTRKYGTYNFDQESSQFRKYQVSIAEALRRKANYKTWAAGKWHLGAYIQPHGLISNATDPNEKRSRMISEPGHNWSLPILFGPKYLGFDHSFISMGGVGGPPYSFFRDGMLNMDPKDYYFWPEGEYECDYGTCAIDKTHSGEGDPNWASAAHDMIIVNETEKFIDNHLQTSPNENFFAYIALGSVHSPHTPPEFWLDGTPVAGQYDTSHLDMLGQMDKAVGSIVKIIEDRNLQEDTVIIFTSDNGGLRDSRPGHISSGPLKGAKKEIWEGGHRVPLIIRFDGKVPMNEKRNRMVGINDIYETICDIVGIDKPGGAAVDSWSFASYLFDEKKQTDLRKYLSHFRMDREVQHAIRWWNMKLIHVPKNNTFSLYNLNKDIGESYNLIKKPWVKKYKRIQTCILGVAAKGGDNYRDADSPEAEFTDVQTLVKSRHHSNGKSSMKGYDKDTSGKYPKSIKKSSKSSPSNTPAVDDTTGGQDETGPSTERDVNPAEETLVEIMIPEFQVIFTLGDEMRNLRTRNRNLNEAIDAVIYSSVFDFIKKTTNPKPDKVKLVQTQNTLFDEESTTIVSSFKGSLTSDEYVESITVEDAQDIMVTTFSESKMKLIKKLWKSDQEVLKRVEDVEIVFVEPEETGTDETTDGTGTDESDLDVEGEDVDIDIVTEYDAYAGDATASGDPAPEDVITGAEDSVTLNSDKRNYWIAGALFGTAGIALFAAGYLRRNRNEKEYEITSTVPYGNKFDEDFENSDEAKSYATPPGNTLSDYAMNTPNRSALSYIGAVAKSWNVGGNTMSDLAAASTQEEFSQNGMKVDVYGSGGEERKPSKRRLQKVTMMLKKNSPRGGELSTDLDPIVEVNSAVSGDSSRAESTESWQQGKKEINNAPPLLPALSVSSAPSDETPDNYRTNFDGFNALAPPSVGTPDLSISFDSPLAAHPDMTMATYEQMVGADYSPNMTNSSPKTASSELLMRALQFSDSSGSEKSLEKALNPPPKTNSSSNDFVHPHEMLHTSAEEPMSDISVSGSEKTDVESEGDVCIDDILEQEFPSPAEESDASVASSICPPEVEVQENKMVINDEISGLPADEVEKPMELSADTVIENELVTPEKTDAACVTEDNPAVAELSYCDSESSSPSIITVGQFMHLEDRS